MRFRSKSKIQTLFQPKNRFSPKKKVFTEIETDFSGKIGNSNAFLGRFTTSTSQLQHPISFGGGLFSFFHQKPASKAPKTCDFAYFTGQWVFASPPLATLLAQPEYRKLQSGLKKAYPRWNNMRKHTRTSHFKEYDAASKKRKRSQTQGGMIDDYFKRFCNQDEDENGNQKLTVTFEMNPNQLKDIVRLICIADGLPFNAFEKSGLKQLTNPILQQFKKSNEPISLNSKAVRQIVLEGASNLKKDMIKELSGKLLCLKFDLASRLGRHFIGLNVQYCSKIEIICKTLAVQEVKTTATGSELSNIIQHILQSDFDIDLAQIYSITTDNGCNALAATNLISNIVEVELGQESLNSILDNLEDIIAAEQLLQSSLLDLKTAMEGVHLVRCASHTLALVVEDCIGRKGDESLKELSAKAKNVVCTLLTSNMRKELRKKNLPMAIIDVETRWGSTYHMLERLLKLSSFCRQFESLNEKLKLSALEWEQIEEMVQTLTPVRILTTQLQSSQLTPG